jgi:hypothetical protein
VLIARGKDYLIHAVPVPTIWSQFGEEHSRMITPLGLVVLHTSTTTGEMKKLITGAETWDPLWHDRSAPPARRLLKGIAGIACDSQRLYVLHWKAAPYKTAADILADQRSKGSYRLVVFRAADGQKLYELDIERRALPAFSWETTGKGPLRLRDGGVSCFGVAFLFKGDKLLRRVPEGPAAGKPRP